MTTDKTSEIRAELMKALAEAGEDGMTLAALASALECGPACLRPILADLGSTMAIRSTQGMRNVRYWIPSEARLKAEEAARQVRIVRPLVVDKQRRELYARIDAERNCIKSIG